jgi:hypothetical protein
MRHCRESAEDLQAVLAQFAEIAGDLKKQTTGYAGTSVNDVASFGNHPFRRAIRHLEFLRRS